MGRTERFFIYRAVKYFASFIMLLSVSISCVRGNVSHITLVNASAVEVEQCTIELSGKTVVATNLKKGDSVSLVLSVKGDNHYKVTVKFHEGRELKKELGYVTSGFNYRDTILIKSDDVILSDRNIEKRE